MKRTQNRQQESIRDICELARISPRVLNIFISAQLRPPTLRTAAEAEMIAADQQEPKGICKAILISVSRETLTDEVLKSWTEALNRGKKAGLQETGLLDIRHEHAGQGKRATILTALTESMETTSLSLLQKALSSVRKRRRASAPHFSTRGRRQEKGRRGSQRRCHQGHAQ